MAPKPKKPQKKTPSKVTQPKVTKKRPPSKASILAAQNSPAPVGRPTKYLPEYCERLERFLGEGFSFEAFAGEIYVSYDTLYTWAKEYPEFSEAKKRGIAIGQKFWENAGRTIALTDTGNSTAWIFMMKNRYKWGRETNDTANIETENKRSVADEIQDALDELER